MNKKRVTSKTLLIFLSVSILFFVLLFSISFVSAAGELQYGSQKLVELIQEIFGPLFGSWLGGDGYEYLFESILFFFILLSFVYVVLNRMDLFRYKPAALWTVVISVAVLSARFTLNSEWVKFALLPYSIVGVAIISIIPFVLYFYFIENFDSSTVRKFGWALYTCIYIGLWYSQSDSIGDISYIYLFAAILGLILIAADGSVRGWMARRLIQQGLDSATITKIAKLQKEISDDLRLADGELSPRIKDQIYNRIDDKKRELKRVSKGFKI